MKGFAPYKNWRIRDKLSFVLLVTTAVALLLAFSALLFNEFYIYNNQQRRKLETLADVIGGNIQASVAFADAKSAETTLASLRAEKHVQIASVYDAEGKLFAQYRAPRTTLAVPATSADMVRRLLGARAPGTSSPIVLDGRSIGTLYIE
ncbi:MAG TPA: CHASE sensor domain-containing protein, partial [Candidatus Eisenbacteria bacterium]|nr:CHASE sensor domain-containing protein [Candidatus Eisenbacteria bacterium]